MKVLGIGDHFATGTVVSITCEGVKVDVKGKSVVLTLAEVESIIFGD